MQLGAGFIAPAFLYDDPFPAIAINASSGDVTLNYTLGSANPPPKLERIFYRTGVQDVTIQYNPVSWLQLAIQKIQGATDLTLNFDPTGLAPGQYTANIGITPVIGSNFEGFTASAAPIHVTLNVSAQPALSVTAAQPIAARQAAAALDASPKTFVFALESGTKGPNTAVAIQFGPVDETLEIRSQTDDGANWLGAVHAGISLSSAYVRVTVDATNLKPGAYHGTITGTSNGSSAKSDVTLTVYAKAPSAPVVNTTALTFTTPAGVQSASQAVTVTFPGVSSLFKVDHGPTRLFLDSVNP
ncbi:MAG: hypothetical protein ABI995_13015, partial [Acidobacteriota bacterium]